MTTPDPSALPSAPPSALPSAAKGLAEGIAGAALPASGLTRRTAVVSAYDFTTGTVTLTWPTGGTVTSVPIICDPPPQAGDNVMLLGLDMDWCVVGVVAPGSSRPMAGRGYVARVSTTSDAVGTAGPTEFEIPEMRTST